MIEGLNKAPCDINDNGSLWKYTVHFGKHRGGGAFSTEKQTDGRAAIINLENFLKPANIENLLDLHVQQIQTYHVKISKGN